MRPPYRTPTDHPHLAGIPRTIENTREWLGEDDEYEDARTRPAPVTVNDETGDVTVDMGTLSNLFPTAAPSKASTSGVPPPPEPKVLITTSPGKPPAPFTKGFLEDLQALLGGKKRADVVPRKSPKFELSRVARWARKRGYGAIMVVGEDHAKPSASRDPLWISPLALTRVLDSHSYLDCLPPSLRPDCMFPFDRHHTLQGHPRRSEPVLTSSSINTNLCSSRRATPSQHHTLPNLS